MKDNKKTAEVLLSTVIGKEKKCNCKKIIITLAVILLVLVAVIIYLLLPKDEESKECSAVSIKEVDPKYQLINYNGFRFKMPLNWDFVSTDNKYEITDEEERLYIEFDYIEEDYALFSTSEYQKGFLEDIQTSADIKIDFSKKEDNYYIYEGTFNTYDYIIIALGNEEKTILINIKFVDKVAYNELKEEFINFSLSAI